MLHAIILVSTLFHCLPTFSKKTLPTYVALFSMEYAINVSVKIAGEHGLCV